MGIHFREQESFVRIVELTPTLRKRIEATIEHLLAILDEFDGDENLEDGDTAEEAGDNEPSLGWTEIQARSNIYGSGDWAIYGLGYDRELDTSDDEDNGDLEPTLGAVEHHPVSWNCNFFRLPYPRCELRYEIGGHQVFWGRGPTTAAYDEREEENEHGGDILDEPHDNLCDDDEEDHRGCLVF